MNGISNGIEIDEIIQDVHLHRFKEIFGDNLDLVKIRGKFKYGVGTCGICVRDLLVANIPFYINLAMSATKTEIKEILAETFFENHKHHTDMQHGTATHCVKSLNCEINVIRSDVPRKTTIPHSINWRLFQSRRVFNVNALLLGFDGKVYNYFSTHDQFIQALGETDKRINEDYSRILRYFRIFGRVANENSVPDERTINAVKINISGLDTMKGDQMWNEMKIILHQPSRGKVVNILFQCGAFKYLGLPENADFDEFQNVSRNSYFNSHPLLPVTYLSAFLKSSDEALKLYQRLKFTAYERDLACFIATHKAETRNMDDLDYYQRMCSQPIKGSKNKTKEYVLELLKYHNKSVLFRELMLSS